MALRLDGKVLAKAVEHRLSAVIKEHQSGIGRPPGLAVLRVGDDPASAVYVANKEKACVRIGVASFGAHLAAETAADAVLGSIRALNADPRVDGILLQLPLLPSHGALSRARRQWSASLRRNPCSCSG